jgi:hypothetical protein
MSVGRPWTGAQCSQVRRRTPRNAGKTALFNGFLLQIRRIRASKSRLNLRHIGRQAAAIMQALINPACVPVAAGLKAGNGFLILAAVACCDLRMDDGVAICLGVGHDFDAGVRLDTCIDSIPA